MGRLIDACEVIEKINGAIELLGIASKTAAGNEGFQTTIKAYRDVRDAIMQEPIAGQEIILCKDCKHWLDIDDGRQKHRMCADVYGDWFCADAEREENEDKGGNNDRKKSINGRQGI